MLRTFVWAAVLGITPLAAARAEATYATLASNLDATSQTSGAIQFLPLAGTTFAQRFTTGTLPSIGDGDSSGQILYRFAWQLLPAQGTYDPFLESFPDLETTYQVNLFTDASGAPGTSLLTEPATGSLAAAGAAQFAWADLIAAPHLALQSNTSYWLTVAFQSASDLVGQPLLMPVTTDVDQTGPGTVTSLLLNTGSGWGGISERALVQIQAEVVPEPSALALAAAGLALVAWRCRRRAG